MKILVVAHYQGDGSPTAIFIHDQMKAFVEAGHEVMVISPVGMGKKDFHGSRLLPMIRKEMIDGIKHVYLRYLTISRFGNRYFNHASAIAMLKLHYRTVLDGFRPDVIHAHTLGFNSEIGAWLKNQLGLPLVVTTHGSDTTVLVNRGELDDLRVLCSKADVVVAVSNALENRLRLCGTQTEIRTIHNGYNDEGLAGHTEKEPYSFLQVSNLIELKQIPVTIRAFEKIYRQYPQSRLTIIGRGPDREMLEKLCDDLQISEAVTFTGQLQHHEVIAHMAKTQFYVMPSVREGLPISYLEAMGMRCVVVGTATEGIAEIISNGVNGFLVQPGDFDAIAQYVNMCFEDPAKALYISTEGEKTAKNLTWRANAQCYEALFRKLSEGE